MSMIQCIVAVTSDELNTLISNQDDLSDWLEDAEDAGKVLDLDKSWHGLHFLLTGTAWDEVPPLGHAILGGEEIGEDLGYGPARYLTADQVKAVAIALTNTPENFLTTQFSPPAMNEADIYPGIWDEGQEALDYLLTYYRQLVPFYTENAKLGNAVIHYVS